MAPNTASNSTTSKLTGGNSEQETPEQGGVQSRARLVACPRCGTSIELKPDSGFPGQLVGMHDCNGRPMEPVIITPDTVSKGV